MKHLVPLLIACLLVASGNRPALATSPPPAINISALVASQDVDPERSCLMIERLSDGALWVSNMARTAVQYPPASTSKIPHTLIALETGFASTASVFEWDGVKRFYAPWNADQTLASAYRYSAVWVYQRITAGLGHDVMADWIRRFDYGNTNIGTVDDLTTYWLEGPLETSAYDQINFLTRLARRELPVSQKTYAAGLPLMVADQGDGWTLYAKTGWRSSPDVLDIGWYVGWADVETSDGNEVYLFALNLDLHDPALRSKRVTTVRHVLSELGLVPDKAKAD